MLSFRIFVAAVPAFPVVACSAPPPDGYVEYGSYFASEGGETAVLVRQLDSAGKYVDWLQWGYDAEPPSSADWMVTESLSACGVPDDATVLAST